MAHGTDYRSTQGRAQVPSSTLPARARLSRLQSCSDYHHWHPLPHHPILDFPVITLATPLYTTMVKDGKKSDDEVIARTTGKKITGAPPSPPESPKDSDPQGKTPTAATDASHNMEGRSNASSNRDPTASAVSELLKTMQNTLGSLGRTFDLLGDQTMHVASLGPAVDALFQITAVRGDIDDQHAREEDRMQQVKTALQDKVKGHLRETLKPKVNQIVAEVVKQAVADRVQRELAARIPSSLRQEIQEYKWQILRVKTSLHNSEARRHNAMIRATGLEEPLQPLLRPLNLPPVEGGNPAQAQGSGTPTTPTSTPPPGARRGRGSTGNATTRLSIKTDTRSVRTSAAVTALEAQSPRTSISADGLGGPRVGEIEAPTPSPLFPRDLMSLVSLGPDDAKTLVRDYGLVSYEGDEATDDQLHAAAVRRRGDPQGSRPDSTATNASGQSWANAGLRGSREEDLNRFMRYIGADVFSSAHPTTSHMAVILTRLGCISLVFRPQRFAPADRDGCRLRIVCIPTVSNPRVRRTLLNDHLSTQIR
ncbi:hypothetical protein C8Q80DRAFT_488697 [Daedaleopsis nitida]|nr:hypothetical protein C8Q80DRAFT_488697 [Daedaleopsis nitida]